MSRDRSPERITQHRVSSDPVRCATVDRMTGRTHVFGSLAEMRAFRKSEKTRCSNWSRDRCRCRAT